MRLIVAVAPSSRIAASRRARSRHGRDRRTVGPRCAPSRRGSIRRTVGPRCARSRHGSIHRTVGRRRARSRRGSIRRTVAPRRARSRRGSIPPTVGIRRTTNRRRRGRRQTGDGISRRRAAMVSMRDGRRGHVSGAVRRFRRHVRGRAVHGPGSRRRGATRLTASTTMARATTSTATTTATTGDTTTRRRLCRRWCLWGRRLRRLRAAEVCCISCSETEAAFPTIPSESEKDPSPCNLDGDGS